MLQILYISGLQPFLYNRFSAIILLENRPLPMLFVLSENIILITNTLSAANEISTGSPVNTNQNEIKYIWWINVIHFQKSSWFQLMRTLRWCLSAKVFKAGGKLVSLGHMAFPLGLVYVKTFAVFVTQVRCLTETLLRKMRRGKRQ